MLLWLPQLAVILVCGAGRTQERLSPDRGAFSEAGLHLGLGGPYAFGAEFAFFPRPWYNLNAGAGVGLVGLKVGTGVKVFRHPGNDRSLFIGMSYLFSTGIPGFTYTDHIDPYDEDAIHVPMKVTPGHTIIPRAGMRFSGRSSRSVYLSAGYGLTLSGGRVRYIKPLASEQDRDKVPEFLFEPGGLEVSAAFCWRLRSH